MFMKKAYTLLFWVFLGLSSITTWLPFWRTSFESNYRWGNGIMFMLFRGQGFTGDYFYLVFKIVSLLLVVFVTQRVAHRAVRWAAMIWWLLPSLADATYNGITDPAGYMFHGDTLGIHINMLWMVLPITLGTALLFTRLMPPAETSIHPLIQRKPLFWIFLVGLLVVSIVLNMGQQHGVWDKLGVTMLLVLLGVFTQVFGTRATTGSEV